MNTDWSMKMAALLRCSPEGAFLTEEQARKRCAELLAEFGLDPTLSEAVEEAHRNAYGIEQALVEQPSGKGGSAASSFIHPFSAQRASMAASPPEILSQEARIATDRAVKAILATQGRDPKRDFLALWRLLPDYVTQNGLASAEKNREWPTQPASGAIPYQSIWQHARIASAFAGAGRRPALLVFNVASAQDFLTTARRTQDLWMGSFLLSYLCWSGMKVIAEELGPDCLIIPDLRGQPLVDDWLLRVKGLTSPADVTGFTVPELTDLRAANLPNVFTAILPADSGVEIAERVERVICQAWDEMADAVRIYVETAAARIPPGKTNLLLGGDPAWTMIWERQRKAFPRSDLFWALVPWPPDDHDRKETSDIVQHVLGETARGIEDTRRALNLLSAGGDAAWGQHYALSAAMAGRVLEARKGLRTFTQIHEDGEKCTLCGRRSALRSREVEASPGRFSYPRLQRLWNTLSQVDTESGGSGGKLVGRLRHGERLCSVCLTKRLAWEAFFISKFGLEEKRPESHVLFPSTSTVATTAFRRDVLTALAHPMDQLPETARLGDALTDYVRAATRALTGLRILYWSAEIPGLKRAAIACEQNGHGRNLLRDFLRLDGDWLHEESFDPESIEREYGIPTLNAQDRELVSRAREALRDLIREAGKLGIPKPDTYYALIAMDGDRMGDWLTGRRGPQLVEVVHDGEKTRLQEAGAAEVRRPAGAAPQAALAEAAKTFALVAVPQIVEQTHCGRVIYAGGDDILAFVPLDELLTVLSELQSAYQGDETGCFESSDGSLHLAMGEKATISAGVAVAHHAHPFSQVVEIAHGSALKHDAKIKMRRDAFSIQVHKRSGEMLRAYAKWHCGKQRANALAAVESLRSALADQDEAISDRFIKDLEAEGALAALPSEAQEAELARLLGRRAGEESLAKADQSAFLRKTLAELLHGLREEELAAQLTGLLMADGKESSDAEDLARRAAAEVLALLDSPKRESRDTLEVIETVLGHRMTRSPSTGDLERVAEELAQHDEFNQFTALLNLARFLSRGRRQA